MRTFNQIIQDSLGKSHDVIDAYMEDPIRLSDEELDAALQAATHNWTVYLEFTPSDQVTRTLKSFIDDEISLIKTKKLVRELA